MANQSAPPFSGRLTSLDAYRGFVMLAMASAGLGLSKACSNPKVIERFDGKPYEAGWHWLCAQLAFHTEHVPWGGCSFWDLIQPSFMFLVGVALPFSFASREALGQDRFIQFLHVLKRSVILILLGIFLSSNWSQHTNFVFTNVLTQIGLGYPIVWLLLNHHFGLQLCFAVMVLAGYWYAFFCHDPGLVVSPEGFVPQYEGLAAHWNKYTNWAAYLDQTFLNWFPQYNAEGLRIPFRKPNEGGYTTLNFVPSMVTMLFGLMTGELLRSQRSPNRKTLWMIAAGALCLILGLALDPQRVWWLKLDWSTCPIVKRLWTPSWTLFSTGWTLWMLAGFYWVIDVKGWKWWAFPLTVVGMNSIAMYCMSQLLKPWFTKTLKIHVQQDLFTSDLGKVGEYSAHLLIMWLICLWMYRQKIFVRI
jgi:heparan-alpha-glucosaminide N-acetyltransferase